MRRIIDQLTRALRQFREQRDALLLLVPCGDSEVAMLLKVLRDLDRQSPSDLYLLFGSDFKCPKSFVTDLAGTLQQELTLTNGAIGPEEEKLPPLPPELLDQGNSPAVRLKASLQYAQSLVDPRRGQRFIWGMGPGTVQDPRSYLALLAELLPRQEVLPWMRGARIVARVPADFHLKNSALVQAPWVTVEPFVIPPNAHEEGLLADAADPALPLGERMQAEVQLAYLDYAHSRFEAATRRFRRTLAFFQRAEIPVMEGLILNGLGDIARRQANWEQAQRWYGCAVVPAGQAENLMLLAAIVQNLAVVAYAQGRFADAEERYTELATLKRGMFDEVGLAEALEWQGVCQEKQKALERALASWEESALICKCFDLKERFRSMLDHLRRAYEGLGMRNELNNLEAIWSI
jgi:hypothetical protein